MNKEESKLLFSENYEPINFNSKVAVAFSLQDFDLNQKKILTKVYASIKQLAMGENHYFQTMTFMEHLQNYMQELELDYELPLWYEESQLEIFFKSINLSIKNLYYYVNPQCITI